MKTVVETWTLAAEHLQANRLEAAEKACLQILQIEPNQADTLHLLGLIAMRRQQHKTAISYIECALQVCEDEATFHNNLGEAQRALRLFPAAVASFRRALQLMPDLAATHYNLGNAFNDQGEFAEAAACYRRALELKPDYAAAHGNLGVVLREQGRLDEALRCFQQAIQLRPDCPVAHNNLGVALKAHGQLAAALSCYQRAVRLNPDYPQAHNNLGDALKDMGKLDEALTSFRRALQVKPDLAEAHSNLVYTLHFCADANQEAVYEEHRHWNRLHAAPLTEFIQHCANDRTPDRPVRVGYVSPDFRSHPVGRFMAPLMEAHDHANYEIFCYSSVNCPDAITQECQAHADGWHDVLGKSDESVAEKVRQDQIDILVDLSMHTAKNRLLLFARKPAPVQVTYLAYCGTTGLNTIDYRLTDPYLDPPGGHEPYYSEKSVHLPETYWCYRAPVQAPEVNALPALENGHVTFGCLNNFTKLTVPTLTAWSELLRAMPTSVLLLHAPSGTHRQCVLDFFVARQIAAERVQFLGPVPAAEYFRAYGHIDVALDPFPYGGGTTTCDALWMGVPVVSLAGRTGVGRGGLSILSNIGLAELVANDVEELLRIALELANDLPRLIELRASLRDRMRQSPLTNAPRFARHVEAAYRDMWRRWCACPK